MSETDSRIAQNPQPAADRTARVRDLALRAWDELQHHDVLPTPRNFELWFTYLSGSNPALSHQFASLLERGTPTPQQLAALHSEYMLPESDVEAVASHAAQLQVAAQSMVDHVAQNQESLQAYGEVLSGVASNLDKDRTVDGLLRAVTMLSKETSRAGERNRALEQQLSASSVRITKLRHELDEARQNATTDSLTGLCNRRAFDSRLRQAVMRAKSDHQPVSLVLLDIDHFKQFNDTHGHRTGDLVLRLVARMIADNVKGRDTAARYGGEEFAVILTGAELTAAAIVARQICASLDGKRLIVKRAKQNIGSVTISAGVAQLRAEDSIAVLTERADAALYEAKRLGRNQVCTEAPDQPDEA